MNEIPNKPKNTGKDRTAATRSNIPPICRSQQFSINREVYITLLVNMSKVTPDVVFPKSGAERFAYSPTFTGVGWGYPAKGAEG
jgi:hypothetical protein